MIRPIRSMPRRKSSSALGTYLMTLGGSRLAFHHLFRSAIKSPHILELSGIGRPEVLKKIGVPVRVELPGVGENVQDHIFGCMSHFSFVSHLAYQGVSCYV